MYGIKTFKTRGVLNSSVCLACNSSCDECIGPSGNQCISCKKGYYLALNVGPFSYGTCLKMKPEAPHNFELYVKPERNFSSYSA